MIRTDPNGRRMAGNGPIGHAAHGRAVDVFAADAEANDAAGRHVDPAGLQVVVVRALGDLAPAVKIGDALAQGSPREPSVRVVLKSLEGS